jgi:hypothetical protein
MARTYQGMKTDRANARRQLANLRTTRIDARHESVSDVLSIHDRYMREDWDDETDSA